MTLLKRAAALTRDKTGDRMRVDGGHGLVEISESVETK